MIKQRFCIESYWKVIVYYNVDYSFFNEVSEDLKKADSTSKTISEIYANLVTGKAKAVTYSNLKKHVSIVLFNYHPVKEDYINSVVHEAEHVKQAMLDSYRVKDEGESPAYTIGYLVMKMWKGFKEIWNSYAN